MIDYPNPLRILPMAVLSIFLLADESWQQVHPEEITGYFPYNSARHRLGDYRFLKYKTVEVGSDLKMSCWLNGNRKPTVEWYKDERLIRKNDERIQIVENYLLLFHTNISDSGSYTCFSYTEHRGDQGTFKITINVPVRVNVSLPTTMIPVGSVLMIPCSVEGYPIPTVTWYKDGQMLSDNERTKATENRLIIFRTSASDLGSYTCKANNSYSSDETTVNITMNNTHIASGQVILWIALVQVIFLLLAFCLIHLLINQKRKEEKLKEPMDLTQH